MKVSVWMSAYNHEKYIEQCLDSVLNQKTNFDFEIILGEDFSTDRTREIVIEYQKKFPEKIHLYLPEKNIGMMEIDIATFGMCKGEYIALLNGDDYWTDENKLQIQSDFLDNNPDASMCFHKAKVDDEKNSYSWETEFTGEGEILPVECLLRGYNPIMTPSVMIRNVVKLPDWYAALPYGDMPLYLILSGKGKIKYIDKTMCVYRIHSNGNWQGESAENNLLKDLDFYEFINKKFDFKYDNFINKIFAQRYFDLILCGVKKNNIELAKKFFDKLVMTHSDYVSSNENDIANLRKVLFEGECRDKFTELINREVKWRVN